MTFLTASSSSTEARGIRGFENKIVGKRFIGIGAAAKATVLLNFAGLDTSFIDFMIDNTPFKQGKYIPGVGIPIFSEIEISKGKADFAVIFAWNHAEEIIKRYRPLFGGKFLIPVPKVKLI